VLCGAFLSVVYGEGFEPFPLSLRAWALPIVLKNAYRWYNKIHKGRQLPPFPISEGRQRGAVELGRSVLSAAL
jgi:hypothetical protein